MAVTSIVLVRHGQAERGVVGAPDQIRDLSELGRRQAERRRDYLQVLGGFGLVITSGLARTNQTAAIISGMDAGSFVELASLFTPQGEDNESSWCRDVLETAFKKPELGYAPLAKYFAESDDIKKALEWYAARAWREIWMVLDHKPDVVRALLVAHALYIPMILWLIYPPGREKLEAYNMMECGCISITLDDNGLVLGIEYLPDVHQDPPPN